MNMLPFIANQSFSVEQLPEIPQRLLNPNFVWIPADGAALRPSLMSTNHLFNVLKMIWNNRMPALAHVGTPIYYNFPEHSDDYLKESILNIYAELRKRDLSPWQTEVLTRMHNWFNRGVLPHG